MAGNHEVIAQAQTIEALGTTKVRDVMEISVTTNPSQLYFEFRIPVKSYNAAAVGAKAAEIAGNLETIMGSPTIGGMSYTQDVNPSGLLVDMMDIVVQTPAADAFQILRKPLKGLTWDSISGEVIEIVNELYATQNA